MQPVPEATVLTTFPIAWFFGFLYYTDVPSLLFVVLTTVFAMQERHWLAAMVGLHLGESVAYGVKGFS
jgi:alpha-1,2-glucosyltransferase